MSRLTEMDALVYGHIYALLNTPLPAMEGKLTSIVKRYDKLIEHCKKIHYFTQNKEIQLESSYTAVASSPRINQDNVSWILKNYPSSIIFFNLGSPLIDRRFIRYTERRRLFRIRSEF